MHACLWYRHYCADTIVTLVALRYRLYRTLHLHLFALRIAYLLKATAITAPFLEQFTSDWKSRWVVSAAKKVIDGVEDEALLRYVGEWALVEPKSTRIPRDTGMQLKSAAAHSVTCFREVRLTS